MTDIRKALEEKIRNINDFEEAPIQNSGLGIRKDKDPLARFDGWGSAPDFLLKMVVNSKNPIQMKTFMEQVIRELHMTPKEQRKYLRPDPMPQSYIDNYNELLEAEPILNANPTGLTIDQILGQDRHFHREYVNNNTFAQICARYGLTDYTDAKKWEIKHHKIEMLNWPKFSHDFRDLGAIDVSPEGVKSQGYGWGMKYEIPFTMMDQAAGGTYDPDYWSVYFIGQQMGIFGDQRGFMGGAGKVLGTAGRGAPNLFGLNNWSDVAGNHRDGIISPIADYGFSAGKGDFDDNFQDILTALKGNNVYGSGMTPIVYVSTPGICAETVVHDSTVGDLKTLTQQLQHKWFGGGVGNFSSWYCTENLTSVANASMTKAKQRWLAFVASPKYIRRKVVYPLQRKILSERFKTYPDDIAFAYITGDILQVYDYNAIVGMGSDSNARTGTHGKSTYAGWAMNGLYMNGAPTKFDRALRPGVE